MKTHNSAAYSIVINSRYLMEKALDLYHAASRGESTTYDVQRLQDELQATAKAFDTFNQSTQEGIQS